MASLVQQVPESGLHLVMESIEVRLDLVLAVGHRVLELHRRQLKKVSMPPRIQSLKDRYRHFLTASRAT